MHCKKNKGFGFDYTHPVPEELCDFLPLMFSMPTLQTVSLGLVVF